MSKRRQGKCLTENTGSTNGCKDPKQSPYDEISYSNASFEAYYKVGLSVRFLQSARQ